MGKQVLSVKEMEHLKKLGVDISKASMCWMIFDIDSTPSDLWIHNSDCYDYSFANPMPTFTLQDILNLLPNNILDEQGKENSLIIQPGYQHGWSICYNGSSLFYDNNLLIAAYKLLCWCVKNGYKLNKV